MKLKIAHDKRKNTHICRDFRTKWIH